MNAYDLRKFDPRMEIVSPTPTPKYAELFSLRTTTPLSPACKFRPAVMFVGRIVIVSDKIGS